MRQFRNRPGTLKRSMGNWDKSKCPNKQRLLQSAEDSTNNSWDPLTYNKKCRLWDRQFSPWNNNWNGATKSTKSPTTDWLGPKTTLRNSKKEWTNLKTKSTSCPFPRVIKNNLLLKSTIKSTLLINWNRNLPKSINNLHFLTINSKGSIKSMLNCKKLTLCWTIKKITLLSGSVKLISPSDKHKKTSPDWTVNLLEPKANSHQSKENSTWLKVKSHH